jgi:sugar (pentulose or hexulose) kinase
VIGDLCVGIDLGTSGVRAVACDETGSVVGQGAAVLARPVLEDGRLGQDPALWWEAVRLALARLFAAVPASAVGAVAVDGTSGTLLVSDGAGRPLGPALMYNDGSCAAEAARIRALAPPESGAHGASSALAKLLRALGAQRREQCAEAGL